MRAHVIRRLRRRDMFHHHAQTWRGAPDRVEHPVDEGGFTVEDIDLGRGDLAMGAKRHADLGHLFQHRTHLVEIRHAGGGVRRRPRRVELDRARDAVAIGCGDVLGIGLFGEVEGHQRLERHAVGQGGEDAVAVGGGLGCGHDGGHEVRHDDRTREMTRGFGQDGGHHRAIAQMQVPVVGTAEGQAVAHVVAITQARAGMEAPLTSSPGRRAAARGSCVALTRTLESSRETRRGVAGGDVSAQDRGQPGTVLCLEP